MIEFLPQIGDRIGEALSSYLWFDWGEGNASRPKGRMEVPDVRGLTVEDARLVLSREGFTVEILQLEERPAPVMGDGGRSAPLTRNTPSSEPAGPDRCGPPARVPGPAPLSGSVGARPLPEVPPVDDAHADALVDTCRPRRVLGVDIQPDTLEPASGERGERATQERRPDPATPMRGEDGEPVHPPAFIPGAGGEDTHGRLPVPR
jgi:hypothetical protein